MPESKIKDVSPDDIYFMTWLIECIEYDDIGNPYMQVFHETITQDYYIPEADYVLNQKANDENLINKHLNRLIFCFYKNFHACYNTLIFRLSSLTTKDKELETIKKILILINNKNINKDFLQSSTLHELYFYFVYNNKEIIKSSLDFTLLINSIQIN